MPVDGDPRGCYAVYDDGKLEFKRMHYDVSRAVARLRSSGLPENVVIRMSEILQFAGRRVQSDAGE